MPAPTVQQQRAIEASGDVLVIAGAGAGKTSTLVARVLDRVLDAPIPQRVPLDRLLVVTFNEAAAAELRHRLRLALETRRVQGVDSTERAAATEALALLDTAQVSTLHAFCLRLLREHFHEVGLDPQFAVQDEVQSAILRQQVLDELFAAHYAGEAPQAEVVQVFLVRHAPEGDESVRGLVLRTSEYARTLAGAESWLAGWRHVAEAAEPTVWRAWVQPGLRAWAQAWRDAVAAIAQADSTNQPAFECAQLLAGMAAGSGACGGGAEEEVGAADEDAREVERLLGALGELVGWGADPHYPRGKKGIWRKPLGKMFTEAEEIQALLVPARPGDADPLQEDWTWVRGDLRALLLLVAQFGARLVEAKRAQAVVDFADLEQFALRLLWDDEHQSPRPLALAWRERLDLVLVDEYQDINEAQDRILGCLSRSGESANRFLVGDVKQSIYRFRRADPRIFQGYARDWRKAGDGARKAVVPLSENFRSHERILGFVNELFTGLMCESIGGVTYDDEARLRYGAPESRPTLRERPEHRVELHLAVTGTTSESSEGAGPSVAADGDGGSGPEGAEAGDGEDFDAEEFQAGLAAERLLALRSSGLEIWDGVSGAYRAANWADMVILHPAPRPVAERWARQFARAGVPLEARRGGFYAAPEVSDLVNLVRILDNPLQDLPLLAVLRSPLVGLTADELAAVRLVRRLGRYWEAVQQFAAGVALPAEVEADPNWRAAGVSARAKIGWFREHYAQWRRIGQEGSLAWCLETALADTSYEAWLRAGSRAEARLANVRRLLALSRQFDRFQRHGIFRFLRFLEAQEDAGQEVESAAETAGDAVRLLSMHQSKGLEFPVVVVAGLGRRFNLRDIQAEWLLDEQYGVCPPVLPSGRPRGYPSLARWFAGHRQRREAIGEQIRLFYVACTRASERLVLLGSVREKRLLDWSQAGAPGGEREILQANDPLGWLGPRLGRLTRTEDWSQHTAGTGVWLDWHIHHAPPQSTLSTGTVPAPPLATEVPPETRTALRGALDRSYPWLAASQEPAKAAVTALRRRWHVADEDVAALPESRSEPVRGGLTSQASPEAVERGLAHHLFCELVRLDSTGTREGLEAEVSRLAEEGWLRPDQVALLDLEGLAGFWTSSLATRIRAHASEVQRELPFTVRLRPSDVERLGREGASVGFALDDFQVVQGVADLAVIGPEEIWLVDYKTDRVEGAEVDRRAGEYRLQLRLYAHALTGIYRRPVTERWLYFVTARRLVAVD